MNKIAIYKIFFDCLNTYKDNQPNDVRNELLNILEEDPPKTFITDDKYHWLFNESKSIKIEYELKLPFNKIIICDNIKVDDDYTIVGLCLTFNDIELSNFNSKEFTNNMIKWIKRPKLSITCPIFTKGNKFKLFDFGLFLDTGKSTKITNKKLSKFDKKCFKIISNYVLNFLLFMNEPRVVTYIVHPNKYRREKKGLIPIPSYLMTKITPELKEYITMGYKKSGSHIGYRFDVVGHWRLLEHPCYKQNMGKRIWIPPYEKGEGLKPPQVFKICKR